MMYCSERQKAMIERIVLDDKDLAIIIRNDYHERVFIF